MNLTDSESALSEAYFTSMYGQTPTSSGPLVAWKIKTTGREIADRLAVARTRCLTSCTADHGLDPDLWPLPHPPAVLWVPEVAVAACLRCTWLNRHGHDQAAATDAACAHAMSFADPEDPAVQRLLSVPLVPWSCDGPAVAPGGQR